MILIITFSILFIISVSLYNVFIIQWGTGYVDRSKQSSRWHALGWIVRFLPAFFIAGLLFGQWLRITGFCLIYLNLAWTLFDMIINLGRGLGLLYQGSVQSGTGSWIDRNINPYVLLITKLVILITTIIYLILVPIF